MLEKPCATASCTTEVRHPKKFCSICIKKREFARQKAKYRKFKEIKFPEKIYMGHLNQ